MNKYSTEEIHNKCQEIWDDEHKTHYTMGWESDGCIVVEKNTDEIVKITLKCMYEAPPLNLNVMRKLADFFGTENINDDDRFSNYGCDTCDYGSSYGYTLSIRPD